MDRLDNYSESKNDVVETAVVVFQSIINDVIKKEMPNCAYVYDPDLSYESALRTLRDNNNSGNAPQNPEELFIFRKTALRYPDEGQAPNMRSTHQRGTIKDINKGKAITYSVVHAEFDMDFIYVNRNIQEMMRFETAYMSEDGITGTSEIKARMGDVLGDFNYFLKWNRLLDLTVQSQDLAYKAFASVLTVRGLYFVFRSELSIIKEIKNNIGAYYTDITDQERVSAIKIMGE